MLSRAIGSLVGHEIEDEQYVVIKAYKFTIFEIWRDFNVLSYVTGYGKTNHSRIL